jgi:hypothetical protein
MAERRWPPSSHYETLLRELAHLIAVGGAWRFLHGPIVAANETSFPEPWDGTRAALARVIGRTLWHAHLDVAAELEDARTPRMPDQAELRATRVELVHAKEPGLGFAVTSIGNDDVAGIVAHEVGRAFVAGLAHGDHPFRMTERGLPDAATGSLATIYLGLGVLAANAAHHDRTAGNIRGRTAHHEHQIAHAGGLDWEHLTFLLAVQATVRDDVIPALASLRPSQAQDVAAWRDVLDDHEAELVAALELPDGEAADSTPTRPASPREVAVRGAYAEGDLVRGNLGRPVFRVPETRAVAFGFLGVVAGLTTAVVGAFALGPGLYLVAPAVAGPVLGWWHGRGRRLYRCATCMAFITGDATECRSCGGKVAGEIRNRLERLDREEELERQATPE